LDWVMLIAVSGIWALVWGVVVDRLYLGVDEISLSIASRKIKISFKTAMIRAILWLFTLSLANVLITAILCEGGSLQKIIQCIESSEKLQSFWMFSTAIAIILSLAGIFSLELGGGE